MKFQWNFRWAFLWLQTGEVEVMACWLERLLAFLVIINDSRFVIVSHTINLQTPTNWSAIESLLITTFGSTSQANDDSHFERTKLRVTKLFMNFTREIRWLTVFFFYFCCLHFTTVNRDGENKNKCGKHQRLIHNNNIVKNCVDIDNGDALEVVWQFFDVIDNLDNFMYSIWAQFSVRFVPWHENKLAWNHQKLMSMSWHTILGLWNNLSVMLSKCWCNILKWLQKLL